MKLFTLLSYLSLTYMQGVAQIESIIKDIT